MLWTVAFASFVAGTLIGLTGIGGVLLVPVLTEFAGVPVERAIAASTLSFVFAGLVAVLLHRRSMRVGSRPLVALCAAAAVGALGGALTLGWLPPSAVRLFIALLALGSGLHALTGRRPANRALPPTAALVALGLVVGYGSAISGTGGPVMLIPILLALRAEAGTAVALGLAAQIPICLTATGVHALAGRLDATLGIALGALLIAGTFAGAWLSRRLSSRGVTVAVALMLIGVGLWYGHGTLAA